MKKFYYLWITVLVILIDQATKLRVRYTMNIGDSISVIGDFFRLTYITNTGAAFSFSFGSDQLNKVIFIIASSLAIILFVYLLSKESRNIVKAAYALILGGAVGNLIDRIAYGAVIDFFDFKFITFIMERWPVFNIADSAIVIAICLLLIDLFFPVKVSSKTDFQTIEESL